MRSNFSLIKNSIEEERLEILRHDVGPRMSRVVEYDNVLYFSGHAGEGGNIQDQTHSLLRKYETLLLKNGSDKKHILTAAVYLSDISKKSEFDGVWDQWIEHDYTPSRCCVESKLSSPDLLVEIVITAVKKN